MKLWGFSAMRCDFKIFMYATTDSGGYNNCSLDLGHEGDHIIQDFHMMGLYRTHRIARPYTYVAPTTPVFTLVINETPIPPHQGVL